MPARLNEEGIDVPANTVLSRLDKAFITLSYPRFDKDVPQGGWTVKTALLAADVPDSDAGQILALMDDTKPSTLQSVREAFQNYNMKQMGLTQGDFSIGIQEQMMYKLNLPYSKFFPLEYCQRNQRRPERYQRYNRHDRSKSTLQGHYEKPRQGCFRNSQNSYCYGNPWFCAK